MGFEVRTNFLLHTTKHSSGNKLTAKQHRFNETIMADMIFFPLAPKETEETLLALHLFRVEATFTCHLYTAERTDGPEKQKILTSYRKHPKQITSTFPLQPSCLVVIVNVACRKKIPSVEAEAPKP